MPVNSPGVGGWMLLECIIDIPGVDLVMLTVACIFTAFKWGSVLKW